MAVHIIESQNLHRSRKDLQDHPIKPAHSTVRGPKAQKGRLIQSHLGHPDRSPDIQFSALSSNAGL